MSGPEHYEHAEELLDEADRRDAGSDLERYCLAAAQVHAALAVAASNVISTLTSPDQFRAWRQAIEARTEEVPAGE